MLLLSADQKRYLVTLRSGRTLHTHLGVFAHDDMIGRELGDVVYSQLNNPAMLLEPSLYDMMTHLKRVTQIVYPKDAAWLVHRLNLHAGSRVIEAGTGSGLTTALAWAVATYRKVYSYEARRTSMHWQSAALERVGLLPLCIPCTCRHRPRFRGGRRRCRVPGCPRPLAPSARCGTRLRRSGFFASLLPTTNQVTELLNGLEANSFVDVTVEELLLRAYKPVPERLRPEDSGMIAQQAT